MLKAWTRAPLCLALCVVPSACGRANYGIAPRDVPGDANPPMGVDAPSSDAGGLDASADTRVEDVGGADSGPLCPLTGCIALDPAANGCAAAEEGPFVEVGRFDTAGAAYGMWIDGPHVLVADTTGGFLTFTFDGAAFTAIARIDTGWTEAIWSRAGDIFVSAPGTGWSVFRLSDLGIPTLLVEERAVATESRRGWSDEARVYMPNGGGGLLAFDFGADVLTPVGEPLATSGWSQGVWSDGRDVFFADGDRFRVVRVDDIGLVELTSVALPGATRVWGFDGEIYAAHATGVVAYTFDGIALTEQARFTTPTSVRDVWSDGVHIFLAAEAAGVYALRLEGRELVQVARIDTDGQALGIVGDGTYLYVGDQTTGIKAYAGFRCTLPRTS